MKGKVAIIDSGIGGLSVYQQFLKHFSNVTYLADNAYFPYGIKRNVELINIIDRIINYFLQNDYKKVILACNTASFIYEKFLKYKYKDLVIPIIQSTINELENYNNIKTVGIVGTNHLISGKIYSQLISQKYEMNTISLPSSQLVYLCEKNDKQGISEYINKHFLVFKKQKIDALILGCTHFNIIEKEISAYFNHEIPIICSGYSIYKQFTTHDLCTFCGENQIFLTDYQEKYVEKIRILFKDLKNIKIQELKV